MTEPSKQIEIEDIFNWSYVVIEDYKNKKGFSDTEKRLANMIHWFLISEVVKTVFEKRKD